LHMAISNSYRCRSILLPVEDAIAMKHTFWKIVWAMIPIVFFSKLASEKNWVRCPHWCCGLVPNYPHIAAINPHFIHTESARRKVCLKLCLNGYWRIVGNTAGF